MVWGTIGGTISKPLVSGKWETLGPSSPPASKAVRRLLGTFGYACPVRSHVPDQAHQSIYLPAPTSSWVPHSPYISCFTVCSPHRAWSDGEGPHPLIIEDRRICSVWEILDFQCHGLKYLVHRDFIPHYSLYFMILIQINLHLVERVGRHNIKVPGPMERAVKGTVQHKWLPTAPGVCSQCVCFHCCVHLGWVKCWALIPSMGHHTWSYVTSLFHYKRTPHTQLSFGPHIELWTAYLFSVYSMTLSLRFVRVYCVPSLLFPPCYLCAPCSLLDLSLCGFST